jgi:S-adenosyl methyltransferase
MRGDMTATDPLADDAETDWSWTATDPGWIPPDIDADRPSSARMHNYALGGKDNFAVDRDAVLAISEVFPDYQALALASRAFLIRAVAAMAADGIDQFIDLGAGVPVSPSVHEAAQQVQAGAKVIYVDNDPIVIAQNRALRGSYPGVLTARHDLRHPATLFADPQVQNWIDLDRPVGLIFTGVLHFVRSDLAPQMIARYRRALAPGSQIAMSMLCADGTPADVIRRMEQTYAASATPINFRSVAQIEQLLEGVELADPGWTDVTAWRTQGQPTTVSMLAGLGRVTS